MTGKNLKHWKIPFCQNSSWRIFPIALALRLSPAPRFSPIKRPDRQNPDPCQPHEFIPCGAMRAMVAVEIGAL